MSEHNPGQEPEFSLSKALLSSPEKPIATRRDSTKSLERKVDDIPHVTSPSELDPDSSFQLSTLYASAPAKRFSASRVPDQHSEASPSVANKIGNSEVPALHSSAQGASTLHKSSVAPRTPPSRESDLIEFPDQTPRTRSGSFIVDTYSKSPLSDSRLSPRTAIHRGITEAVEGLANFSGLQGLKAESHYFDALSRLNSGTGSLNTSSAGASTSVPFSEVWFIDRIPIEDASLQDLNWGDFREGLQLEVAQFKDFLELLEQRILAVESVLIPHFNDIKGQQLRKYIVRDCLVKVQELRLEDIEKPSQDDAKVVPPAWFIGYWVQRMAWLKISSIPLLDKFKRQSKSAFKKRSALSSVFEGEEQAQSSKEARTKSPTEPSISRNQKNNGKGIDDSNGLDQAILRFKPFLSAATVDVLLLHGFVPPQNTDNDGKGTYSFEKVRNFLEHELRHRSRHLKHTELEYARILWADERGEDAVYNEVLTQADFEAAIHHLHSSRGAENVLVFHFMTEPDEWRRRRHEFAPIEAKSAESNLTRSRSLHTLGRVESGSSRTGSFLKQSLARLSLNRMSATSVPPPDSSIGSVRSSQSKNSSKSKLPQVKTPASETLSVTPRIVEKDKGYWEERVVVSKTTAFKTSGGDDDGQLDIESMKPIRDADDEPLSMEIGQEEDVDMDMSGNNANRVVAKLQDLINLPELTQVNDKRWQDCCRMFNINPEKTELSETVHIAGLRTRIYQYQAFGVYWQMLTSRTLGGGFLADSMGLGKTLSFLSFFVVERQLCVLWADVRKSRDSNDGKHLTLEQQSADDICPSSRKQGWISCPCASSSPTSRMPPKGGVRLACVPNELVKSWWAEWKKHVDTECEPLRLGLNLAINYKGAFDAKTLASDMTKGAHTGANINRLKFTGRSVKKDSHHSGWLVITSAQEFMPWVKKYFPNTSPSKDPRVKYCIEFGIAMIDESHEEYFKQTGRAKVLYEVPSVNYEPFLWGYSGTPFSQTPRGLEGVLWAIEQHVFSPVKGVSGWADNQDLKRFQWSNLDKICKAFDVEVKKKNPDETKVHAILAEFVPFLQNFVIRRDADTKWFGHRLIKLKPHYHQDIQLENVDMSDSLFHIYERGVARELQSEKEAALLEVQAKWDKFPDMRRTPIRPEQLAFNTLCRLEWRSRILATIPYAHELLHPKDPKYKIDLTVAETLSFFRRPDYKIKENPYYYKIRNLTTKSPKFPYLSQIIDMLNQGTDHQGEEQKLIIMSAFPQIVFVTYMFILKFMPELKDRVGIVMPGMKPKERSDVLDAFTDAIDDKGKRKQIRNNQILIGTTRLIGKGLQLTRAAHLVLMEPDYEFVNELQAYGRVHRIGQKNPCSYSFRLINPASEIEMKIVARQKAREERMGKEMDEDELKDLGNSLFSVNGDQA